MADPTPPPPQGGKNPASDEADDGLRLDSVQDDGLRLERGGSDDVYGVAEPEPEPGAGPSSVTLPEWYVAIQGGQREGPIGLAEVKQRLATGRMGPETLVWRSGMAGWLPAQSVPEVCGQPAGPGMAPPPPLSARRPAGGSMAGTSEFLKRLDDLLAQPLVYRIVGRVSAALAAVIFVVSLLLWYWKYTWFTGAVFFALVFVVGEAAGAILSAVGRIEKKVGAQQGSPEDRR